MFIIIKNNNIATHLKYLYRLVFIYFLFLTIFSLKLNLVLSLILLIRFCFYILIFKSKLKSLIKKKYNTDIIIRINRHKKITDKFYLLLKLKNKYIIYNYKLYNLIYII